MDHTTRASGSNMNAKDLMQKQRQRKKTRDVNKSNPILVEENKSKHKEPTIWIPELQLSSRDREILLSPTAWLTDSIIDAAQTLLKKATSVPGLQSVCCGLTMTYDVQPGEFIQILHNGHNHWATISTIGTTHPIINVYDSLYSHASTHLKAQIAALLATEKSQILLQFMDVPVQAGACDCGLYAIAFATALALGDKPELFSFNQPKMRQHLLQCFQRRAMQMIPVKRRRRMKTSSVKAIEEVKVYCKCRMPEVPDECMIQCTICKDWFHIGTCISVPSSHINNKKSWYCHTCLH